MCAETMHGLAKVGSLLGGGRFPFGPEFPPGLHGLSNKEVAALGRQEKG